MTTPPKVQNLELPISINVVFRTHLFYNTGYCQKAFTPEELDLLKQNILDTLEYYATHDVSTEDVLAFNERQHKEAKEYYNKVMYGNKKESRENEKTGYIYLVQNTHTKSLKIGFSKKPKNRVSQLNTSSEFPIKLLYKIKGNTKEERAIHRKFNEHHKKLEWFEYSESIVQYFKNLQSPSNNGRK